MIELMDFPPYEEYRAHRLATCSRGERWQWTGDRDLIGNWVSFTMPALRRGRREWPIPQNVSGVYAVYQFGQVVYVGSSDRNIAGRLGCHAVRFGEDGLRVKLRVMRPDKRQIRLRERRLIKRLKPAYNQQWNPLVGR
jgi:hypothetical protein